MKQSLERAEQAEAELRESAGRKTNPLAPTAEPRVSGTADYRASTDYRQAFRSYLIHGTPGLSITELRALEATSDTAGGYLILPQALSNSLLKSLDDNVLLRQRATKFLVAEAKSLGIPSLDNNPDDSDWVAELSTGNFDNTMSMGKRELQPRACAKKIKVSNKLLRQVSDAESLVMNRLAYKAAITEERAFISGNGVDRPLGLFTASANGIDTGRDVNSGNNTNFTADGLIDVVYSVKDAYRSRAVWIMHRDSVKRIRKLTASGTGEYLWQPGLGGGQPDTLLDRPILTSEYAPSTFTQNSYVAIFGDLSFYYIADALSVSIQRLVEVEAYNNQTVFVSRFECDGMPVLAEAFSRVKLSA